MYFVILVSFCCHFFVRFVILDLRCHFVVICFCFFCHFAVILLSFVCHFIVILGTGKWKKMLKTWLPWQTFCYLVAAPNRRNKCRNSWKASRWRRIGQGSFPWKIHFWACLDEELSPGSGCRAGSKTGWGAGPGGPEKRGRPGNSKNVTLPAQSCFPDWESCFWHFFCISQTGSRFFGIFFAFPRPGLPPSPLAWLPDPDEKTARKWAGEIA